MGGGKEEDGEGKERWGGEGGFLELDLDLDFLVNR